MPFTIQTQYFKSGDAEAQLSIVAHLDLNGVRFCKADGRNFDDVTVATVLFDEDWNFVAGGEKLVKLRLFDTSLERLHNTGLVVKSSYGVKPRQISREASCARI